MRTPHVLEAFGVKPEEYLRDEAAED